MSNVLTAYPLSGTTAWTNDQELLFSFLRVFWYIPLAVLLLFVLFSVLIYRKIQKLKKGASNETEFERQLLQSEMKALRSQMNPHFIFNAINSIQHYVLTNEKDLANRYLVKFSRLMRNILDHSKEELITLSEELETVRIYLEIEAMRFNRAFRYQITCDPEIGQDALKLPPMLIQPYVENAIWHGLLLKEGDKQLSIDITRQRDDVLICIEDNGIGRENAGKYRNAEFDRKSLGMDITQSRLNAIRQVHKLNISVEVYDKKSAAGGALGTRVMIKFTAK